MNVRKYLELAAQVSRLKDDDRTYFHGAVGIRKDGVLVCAANGAPKQPTPEHHCEYRLLRKLGKGGVIFMVRTLSDGTYGNSTPCIDCYKAIKRRKVASVHYTDANGHYAVWYP